MSKQKRVRLAAITASLLSLLLVLILAKKSYIPGLMRPFGSQGARQMEKTPVVVAASNILRGQMVTAEKLEITQCPKDMVPKGALGSIEAAQDRAAVLPILAGEPVLEVKLATEGAEIGIAALIPKGMRAFTIVAKVSSSVADLFFRAIGSISC